MKIVQSFVLAALALIPLAACSPAPAPVSSPVAPPSIQECANEHMRLLQEQTASGTILNPDIRARLAALGCRDEYQQALTNAVPASEQSYSCDFPDGPAGPQVCEGNVPASVGEYITP
jgi:Spy/CpxP family protein refolding chaperone